MEKNETKPNPSPKSADRKKRLRRLYLKTLSITLCVFILLGAAAYGGFLYLIGDMKRTEIDESTLSANEELKEEFEEEKIVNLAFFGVDSPTNQGRSDAILVVSADIREGEVKMVSIARDTYVAVPGYGNTKITHAYAYGGAELAIQTLNENFGLDITDYVTVNFDQLADVIDAFGGIDLEVTEEERYQINAYLREGEPLRESGMVHLNGPQAVSYSRIRKIGGDDARTERQRKVLTCLFEKAQEISPLQYPVMVKNFAPLVETSLTNQEILEIGAIGLKSPLSLEQDAFPNDYIEHGGQYIGELWYYVYDLEQASDMLREFLYNDVPFSEYGVTEETPSDTQQQTAPEGTA